MRRFLTTLDWYIIKRLMVTFIFTLLMFNVIGVVFDFIEHVDDFIKRDAPSLDIFKFLITFFPWITGILSHLFLFIAVIFFTSKMANNSEIVAMLATGMSFNRFLRPYVVSAIFIFVILFFSNHYWIPISNKTRFRIQDKYLFPPEKISEGNKHIRTGKTTYAYTEFFDKDYNRASRLTLETFDSTGALIEKTTSLNATFDTVSKEWLLDKIAVISYGPTSQTITYKDSIKMTLDFLPEDFFEEKRPREEYTSNELRARIAKSKKLGLDSYNFLYVELYRRTSLAFAVFLFVIIGACIGSQKTRGGSGIHLALGIVISLVFIFIQQFVTAMSTKGDFPPLLAVWIPNIIFTLVAIYFYRRSFR